MKYLLLSLLTLSAGCLPSSKYTYSDKKFTALQRVKVISGFYSEHTGTVIGQERAILESDVFYQRYKISFDSSELQDAEVCANRLDSLN